MKIKLLDKYKSLYPFESEKLNNFTIITGKNGSGKTQLLKLIELKFKNDSTGQGIRFQIEPEVTKVQIEGIVKENSIRIDNERWKIIVERRLEAFKNLNLNPDSFNLRNYIIENDLVKDLNKSNNELLSNEHSYMNLIDSVSYQEHLNRRLMGASMRPESQNQAYEFQKQTAALSVVFSPEANRLFKFVDEICINKNKTISEIVDADFFTTPIPEYLIDEQELFTSQVELIFYNYAKRRYQNRQNFFFKNADGENNNSVSDEEFIRLYNPPWESINSILIKHRIDFYFQGIERSDFTPEVSPEFKLIKISTNECINFEDLSSGEKVIVGLIIKLFTSEYYKENLSLPDLIILDEPDAHLHPEMSKLLIDVLAETFVKGYNINVIFSTHSPSTIALAPDDSIYQLVNGVNTSLKSIPKDEALEILIGFIPTLSIDYKNHKQIFVESPTDIAYYQAIFNRLYQEKKYPFKLYFISNSYGQGNCDQVKKIVQDIRNSGNTTSYGIIDWDLKNVSSEFIKVHGEGNRYNVETFLYDPIYLAVLFMNMGGGHNFYSELGIDININQFSIGNEDEQVLQKIIDWFFDKYYQAIRVNEESKTIKREVIYYNQKKVLLPVWFLEYPGHDYELNLKKTFQALTKFRNEGELQKEMITIMAKCYPFIPLDSVILIEDLLK